MINLNADQVIRALLKELFVSRRFVVGTFVAINLAMVSAGLLWPHGYTASIGILVDDKNIIQPLMQGAAVATEVSDRAKNAREIIFGRKTMHQVLEEAGWLASDPSPEEQERIAEKIRKRTKVSIVGKNILKIENMDINPDRAYRTTKKFAAVFMEESQEAKAIESRKAFEFIDGQTQEYQRKLVEAEQELKELRSANVDARSGSEADQVSRLNDIQIRIERASQDLREAEIKKQSLERQLSGEAETVAMLTREGQYKSRIAELQQQLETLRLSYRDTYPDIVQLKLQINDLRRAMENERERRERSKADGQVNTDQLVVTNPIYQQMRRESTETQVLIDTLKARIEEGRKQLKSEVRRSREAHGSDARLAELTRDYQVNREIYQDLLKRREAARVSMNLDRDHQGLTFKIIEPVTVPVYPSGLRYIHFAIAGVVLGLALPLGFLYARLRFDPRIRFVSAVNTKHKLPMLVSVPHFWPPREAQAINGQLFRLGLAVTGTVAIVIATGVLRLMKMI